MTWRREFTAGERVPLATWKRLVERLEDEEERVILREWLEKRATGEAETVTLDEVERELIADGLLSVDPPD